VVLVLPTQLSPVLSRELIYTGITRAEQSLEIWAAHEVLAGAIGRSAQRATGELFGLLGRTSIDCYRFSDKYKADTSQIKQD